MIAAVVVSAAGISIGVGTLALVRHSPGSSLGGDSALGAAALLVAGWAMIAAGVGARRRRPGNRVGPLLIIAGFAWFVTEWNNPAAGSSLVFTVGLVGYTACPPLVADAALRYPSGRLGSVAERAVLVSAYVGTLGVLGLGPALFFEPADQGCAQCADNLVAVTSNAELVVALNRAGVWLGVVWSVALAALAVLRLARSTPAARRARITVVLPASAYLGVVAASYLHSLRRGFLSNDDLDHELWLGQALTLTLVAAGVVVEWIRVHHARSAVAATVAELAAAPPPGGLREALARSLGDPGLEVAYPIGDGRYVDAMGRSTSVESADGRATTALMDRGDIVAVVIHRSDLLGDRRLVEDAVSAARLAFQNERLHAEASAQLDVLRDSRHRLVAASDAERRRLERDLHDGAQQRLVGLALSARLTRTRFERDGDVELAERIATVEAELRKAIDEVRDLASGLHPAVLTDYGLAAALRALAETAASPVNVVGVPEERFPAALETASYLLVAEAAKMGPVSVAIVHDGGTLAVDVNAAGEPPHLVDLQDRVAVLAGTMTSNTEASGVRIRVVFPCG